MLSGTSCVHAWIPSNPAYLNEDAHILATHPYAYIFCPHLSMRMPIHMHTLMPVHMHTLMPVHMHTLMPVHMFVASLFTLVHPWTYTRPRQRQRPISEVTYTLTRMFMRMPMHMLVYMLLHMHAPMSIRTTSVAVLSCLEGPSRCMSQ